MYPLMMPWYLKMSSWWSKKIHYLTGLGFPVGVHKPFPCRCFTILSMGASRWSLKVALLVRCPTTSILWFLMDSALRTLIWVPRKRASWLLIWVIFVLSQFSYRWSFRNDAISALIASATFLEPTTPPPLRSSRLHIVGSRFLLPSSLLVF